MEKRLNHCFSMDTPNFEVRMYLIVGVQVIFLAVTGSSLHASPFPSEAGGCNSISDENNSSNWVSLSPCVGNYISKSYFEKHLSLNDSYFQDFIDQELPFGSCEVLQNKLHVPTLSALHRDLIGEGSHRHLSSSIGFIEPESVSDLPVHFCEAIIIERLPSGIFADPFELQHLLERGVFLDAAVFGDTNLELPSVASNRSVVEIHIDVGPNIFTRHKNGPEFNIELPLHARYAPVGEESGFSRVEFGAPDLFVRCRVEGKSNNQSCILKMANNKPESKGRANVWNVPCGIKGHTGVVSVVTFLSAGLSALLIVLTSVCYSDSKRS